MLFTRFSGRTDSQTDSRTDTRIENASCAVLTMAET